MKKIIFIVFVIIIILVLSSSDRTAIVPLPTDPTGENVFTPVLAMGDHFKGAVWSDPSVIKVGNSFVMYSAAGKGFDGDIDIYRLTSADGKDWELDPKQPVLENSTDKSAIDTQAVETPSVVYFEDTYHMFYTGYDGHFSDSKKYRILHATSKDGISWSRDQNFLIAPTDPDELTPNMDFNQWVTAEPGAVVFNDQIFLYFTAIGASEITQSPLSTIGLITSTDGYNWDSPQQVLIPDQTIYPGSIYYGYSTPAAVVHNNVIELYFDIVNAEPWKQIGITKASSKDGKKNWQLDATPLISTESVTWGSDEIVGPSVLYSNDKRYIWFTAISNYQVTTGLLEQ